MPPPRISDNSNPIAGPYRALLGMGQGIGDGLESSPYPPKTTARPEGRVNIRLSPELVRAPVACLPSAARLFGYCHFTIVSGWLSQETPTKIRAADAIAPPTAPISAAAAPLTASGNRCAQNWLSGFLATATSRCRNTCELVRRKLLLGAKTGGPTQNALNTIISPRVASLHRTRCSRAS